MTNTEGANMTEKEKMLSGLGYLAFDKELIDLRTTCRTLTDAYNSTESSEKSKRQDILKELLGSVGQNCYIERTFKCDYGSNIYLGDNVYMNFDCVFLDVCDIRVGKNTLFGPGVHVYAAAHPVDPVARSTGVEFGSPVHIGEDCWIGGKVVICPGVKIGNGVTVAAGAVVTKNVPDRVVVAGVPAKIIKHLD